MTVRSRPTLEDVARLSGVSAKTVSRVFSEPDKVRATTRERVLGAASRLKFRPNTLARDLRRGGITNTVAFVIGDLTNPFYVNVAAGVERELAERGYTMLLATTEDAADSEARIVDTLLAQRVRALLLIPIADDQSYLAGERELGTPVVTVDRPPRDLVADSVVLANRTGMADAVRSLTRLGHRRIGFVSNPSFMYTLEERLAGYRAALAEVGVTDTERWERRSNDPGVAPDDAVRSLLEMDDAPTALVTGNNRATMAALRVLRERSDEVALIGFDDFDLAEMLGVSVVAYDTMELGRSAAQLALHRLDEPSGPTRRVEIPTTLIARGSGEIPPPAAR